MLYFKCYISYKVSCCIYALCCLCQSRVVFVRVVYFFFFLFLLSRGLFQSRVVFFVLYACYSSSFLLFSVVFLLFSVVFLFLMFCFLVLYVCFSFENPTLTLDIFMIGIESDDVVGAEDGLFGNFVTG